MRIHRLEIQAFGPFAERQHIDFDALTEQGLFLLNGPTGAGKSSVLDAICYALYGSVPGARQNARRLRSDHASDGLAPEVLCEFSAGSRRLEVTRNPSWNRPSKRGAGTTTEQAKTLLRERVAGEWVTRSTRNDEAGAELLDLLGMNREQFTRVVMLPQGEFAAFLRSDAASRGELLQRLFATDRFSTVEQLLSEHAVRTSSRLQEVESELEDLLSRAAEEVQRHGLSPQQSLNPASFPESEPDGSGQEGSVTADWKPDPLVLQELLTAAVADGRRRARELTALRDAAAERRSRFEAERRDRLTFRELVAEAQGNQVALDEAVTLKTQLADHRRAQILQGALQSRDEAADEVRRQRADLHSAVRPLQADPAVLHEAPEVLHPDSARSLATSERAHGAVRESLAAARAALPLEKDLTQLSERIRQGESALDGQKAEAARCSEAHTALRQEYVELTARLEDTQGTAARAGQLATECAEARTRLELLAQAELAERSLRELNEKHQEHQTLFLTAKEGWLRRLQVRLEQTAAELAERLDAGEPCPVCGSEDHPAPAAADAQSLVTREDEALAREKQDAAEQQLRETAATRDEAALKAAGLRARSGDAPAEELRAALVSLEQQHAEAERAVRLATDLSTRKTAAETSLAGLQEQEAELGRSQAEESSRLATLAEQQSALVARLSDVRDSYNSVKEKTTALEATERRLGAVCAALSRCEQAEESLEKAEAALQTYLAATDFASAEAVRDALLSSTEADTAERTIRDAENSAHRIERDLQRPENLAAAVLEKDGGPLPDEADIASAATEEADASKRLDRAVLEVGLLEQSVVQMGSYADRSAALEKRLVPLQQAHQLARSIADTARGNGENLYRMSLATYVLAARLEQVADAATERLQRMSDGRYSLIHSDSKSGNRKSGLGLNVIDSWTGMHRDTATLSGGESFMASLALALGLADVVQQESGGLDIETLFVDEGFGSLDEHSLEQVMDALESLRDGGRVVGLVSHVADLLQRIPAQLQVFKSRTGSTVRFVNQLQRV
ncbi:SMC family ATPase [Arthrobacter tumbae]|uniref:AAA family ATPase n=1 Tax=Arthrobacter tumbae TaxID=163874 RepID=UPI001956E847|nr:SMC family ATPase [Arthrobacter tumbae]MBM7779993.1 exonuclease SbcC [Arthrobacter tumbae]